MKFAEMLTERFDWITRDEARAVERYYKKIKVMKFSPSHGWNVTHGSFLDDDVVRLAIARTTRKEEK